jgi:glutamate formiminotransferase
MASFVTRTAWQRALPLACCCKIYVSVNPSSNAEALEKIEAAARSQPEAPLLHVFEDHEYSRVGYTLAGSLLQGFGRESGRLLPPLQIAVTEAVEAALESLDFRQHFGSHPRLGAVDHISLHPLGGVALQDVAPTARAIAQAIGSNFKGELFAPQFLQPSCVSLFICSFAEKKTSQGLARGSKALSRWEARNRP